MPAAPRLSGGLVVALLLLALLPATGAVGNGGSQAVRAGAATRVSDEGLDSILEVMQSLLKSVQSDEADSSATFKKKTAQWEETLTAKADSVKSAENELSAMTEDVGEVQTEVADYGSQVQMVKQSLRSMEGELEDTQKALDKHRAKCIRERTGTKASMVQMQTALAEEKDQERDERRSLRQLNKLNRRLRNKRGGGGSSAPTRGLGADQAALLELQSSSGEEEEVMEPPQEAPPPLSFVQMGAGSAVTRRTVTKENAIRSEYKRFEAMLPVEESECKQEEGRLQDLIVQKKASIRQLQREQESVTKLNAEKQAKLSGLQLDIKDRQRIVKRDKGVQEAVTAEKQAYEENAKAVTAARTEVITTLNEVIDAMGSYLKPGAIAGVQEYAALAKASPQQQAPLSFLQVRSAAEDTALAGLFAGQQQASASSASLADYLANSSPDLSPAALAQLQTAAAATAQAGAGAEASTLADPFASVKDMIQNLLDAAKQKQNEDMGQQEYCDQEKEKSKNAKLAKKDALDMLSAEIRTHADAIEDLSQQVTFATDENQRLATELTELKATQAKEVEAMKTTIGDYGLAVQAVDQAYGLLQNAFGMPATGGFVQTSGRAVTGTPAKILEKTKELKEKFLALKQKLTAAMNEGEVRHETVVKDAEDAQRAWAKSLQDANSEKSTKEELLLTAKGDKKNTVKDLENIDTILGDLEVQCGPQMADYDAAKKRREDEIEALQDAYKVLIGETIPGGAAAASALLQQPLQVADARAATLMGSLQAPNGQLSLSMNQMVSALQQASQSSRGWESQVMQTQAFS